METIWRTNVAARSVRLVADNFNIIWRILIQIYNYNKAPAGGIRTERDNPTFAALGSCKITLRLTFKCLGLVEDLVAENTAPGNSSLDRNHIG